MTEFPSANQQKAEPFPPSPAHDVPVASEVPAEGTSEGAEPVEGVRTSIAPEGLADGETDVRVPPTSTF